MKERKILDKALSGSKNISFAEFVALLEALGFELSVSKVATTSFGIRPFNARFQFKIAKEKRSHIRFSSF